MTTLTGSQMLERVAYATGEQIGPGSRHTPEIVMQLLNESLARYHSVKNESGHPHEVARATATTTSDTTVTLGWPANNYVALPEDFLQLVGCTWLSDGGPRPLNPFTENEKEEAATWFTGEDTGPPLAYRIGNDTDGGRILRLLPASDSAYTLELVYIPTPTAIETETSYTFLHGTEAAVLADVAMQVLDNAGIPEPLVYQSLQGRRDDALEQLRRLAPKQARAGVQSPTDARRAQRSRNTHDVLFYRR